MKKPLFLQPRLKIGPIARISLGLSALLLSLALLADLWLGAVPSQADSQRLLRQRLAENLAVQITALLEANQTVLLGTTIQRVLARDAEIKACTVRRTDGTAVVHSGSNTASLNGAAGAGVGDTASPVSTEDELRVPILSNHQRWGEIIIRFAPTPPPSVRSWLAQPSVQLLLVMGLGGFTLCYVYLSRAMQELNPSASVPDRVRKAFDALAEGLLITDQNARIVLANKAFRELHPDADGALNGQSLAALTWLHAHESTASPASTANTTGAVQPAAWTQTLQTGQPTTGQPLTLNLPHGQTQQLLVSAAAITDGKGHTRGCLITFDNVTAIHQANAELRGALGELEKSRRRIEEQNSELRTLASRDGLTGCFNRRAFFELASEQFLLAQGGKAALCCLMIDIDHFKQFNDRFGHAVGDQVIQVVARSLSAGLRQVDVLGRYGGEEFCVVLPGASAPEAMAIAERMRAAIETSAAGALRGSAVGTITASFGLAVMSPAATSIEALIDQADQALYRAKKAGRNRVTRWLHGAPVLEVVIAD